MCCAVSMLGGNTRTRAVWLLACRLDGLGGPESIPGLVDLLAFASSCRGASEEEVSLHSCSSPLGPSRAIHHVLVGAGC
jgi:hypothetical protein